MGVWYACCAIFAHTHGEAAGASPWYTSILLAPVVTLAYLGLSRWKRCGPLLASAIAALWAWILKATWTLQLFPLYADDRSTPMRLGEVVDWYRHASAHAANLSLLALAPPNWLYAGLAVALLFTVLLSALAIRGVWE